MENMKWRMSWRNKENNDDNKCNETITETLWIAETREIPDAMLTALTYVSGVNFHIFQQRFYFSCPKLASSNMTLECN